MFAADLFAAITRMPHEKASFKTTDGRVFQGVTITKAELDGITIETDSGIEKIPFTALPPDVRSRFGYDPGKAAAYTQQAKQASDAYARSQQTLIAEAVRKQEQDAEYANSQEADRLLKIAKEKESSKPAQSAGSLGQNSSLRTGGLRPPGPSASQPASRGEQPKGQLPWPIEGHTFTLIELTRYQKIIAGNVVRVTLVPIDIKPEKVSDSEYRIFLTGKGDSDEIDNYAYIYFPAAGAEKMELLQKTARKQLSFYVSATTERLTAVGRSKATDSFTHTFAYTW